jgi:hypothetical protein
MPVAAKWAYFDHELILSLGWSKQPRKWIQHAPEPAPLPFVPAPSPGEREELLARAHADGFLYLPRLLAAERLDALRAAVDQSLVKRGWRVDGRSDPALRLGGFSDFLGPQTAIHSGASHGAMPNRSVMP